MKLNSIATGNALGGATAVLFLVCGILGYAATGFLVSFSKSIVHVFDLSSLTKNPQPFELGPFLFGWIGFSALMWVFGWLLGTIYNLSAKVRVPA